MTWPEVENSRSACARGQGSRRATQPCISLGLSSTRKKVIVATKSPKNKSTNELRLEASQPATPSTPVTIAVADEVLEEAASLTLLPPGVTPRASWMWVT